jgi:hypothetical protein
VSEDLTLLPEVQARRKLRKQPVRIAVLAPYGAWIGCGMLRVLRLKMPAQDDTDEDVVELTVGYESYTQLAKDPRTAKPSEAGS